MFFNTKRFMGYFIIMNHTGLLVKPQFLAQGCSHPLGDIQPQLALSMDELGKSALGHTGILGNLIPRHAPPLGLGDCLSEMVGD